MSNQYSQPLEVVSDTRDGFDRNVTYADGRVRRMRNYYLPVPIDDPSKSYLQKTYQFGTALDPYWDAGYSEGTIQLVDDYRDGFNRVAKYSDGTVYVSQNWYAKNPAYSGDSYNPSPVVATPALQDSTTGFPEIAPMPAYSPAPPPANIVPSDVTLPLNLSAPSSPIYPPALLETTPGAANVPFQGPLQENYAPGIPGLATGIGNLTPGVPNTPGTDGAQGPAGLNASGFGGPGLIIAAVALYLILK